MKKDGYEFIGTVEEDDKVLDVLKRVKKYEEANAVETRSVSSAATSDMEYIFRSAS